MKTSSTPPPPLPPKQSGRDEIEGRQRKLDEGTAIVVGGVAALAGVVNPLVGVAAAAIAPLVTNRLSAMYRRRLDSALSDLSQRVGNIDNLIESDEHADLKADALADFLKASSDTDSVEKTRLLLHLIEHGL